MIVIDVKDFEVQVLAPERRSDAHSIKVTFSGRPRRLPLEASGLKGWKIHRSIFHPRRMILKPGKGVRVVGATSVYGKASALECRLLASRPKSQI